MPKLAIVVAALLCASLVLAQDASTPAAPNAIRFIHPSQQLSFDAPRKPILQQRPWYWEVDDTIHPPFPTYRYLPGTMTHDDGFAPMSLSWNFSGKHPLMPVLEVAGMQLKPGERVSFVGHPNDDYGIIPDHSLWGKATHALIAALHY